MKPKGSWWVDAGLVLLLGSGCSVAERPDECNEPEYQEQSMGPQDDLTFGQENPD